MAAKSTALRKEKPVEGKPYLSVLPHALVCEAPRQVKLLISKDTKWVPPEVGEQQRSEQSGKQNHPGSLQHGDGRAAKSYKEGSPERLALVVNGWDHAEDQKYKYTRKREFTDFIYPPLDECYFFTIKKKMFYLKLQFFSGQPHKGKFYDAKTV